MGCLGLGNGKIPSAVADDLGSDLYIRSYLIYMDVTYLYHCYVYSMRSVSKCISIWQKNLIVFIMYEIRQ